ncbi:MAG TPA: peptidoglycan DD-metalloendopeptidase family protein [Burkholderiales bacterium]|jgi:lipoprotein NlpD|nr:peptidoglycan DD-metalloendopeptidase family protein [Burkholderiales bacterium]
MNLRTIITCACAAALLAACASGTNAPIVDRSAGGTPPPAARPAAAPLGPEFYTVKRGDTLYSIALDHGQDYKEVAAWNNIANVNVINVGQVLRVVPPGAPAPTQVSPDSGAVIVRPITPPGGEPAGAGAPAAATVTKNEPNGAKRPYSEEALAQAQREAARQPAATAPSSAIAPPVAATPATPGVVPAVPPRPDTRSEPKPIEGSDDVAWGWPAGGKVIGQFTENGTSKGVDIAAKVGDPVLAAGPGRVVYAGQGLRGYGRLIIIKHNNTYLSAYAHNSTLLVKEGQTVTKGQKIAEAGNTDSDIPKLHFEIRRQGKPVDPTKYLPDR